MIPRIIHQVWIGPRPRPERLMATWRKMNPSFTYELWDDARCAAAGFRNQREIDAQPELAGKADLIRYEVLARHGGVYVDADSRCVRPLPDEMLSADGHDCFMCWENEKVRPGLISNGTIGAIEGCELMQILVKEASGLDMTVSRAWIVVGPLFLTQMVVKHAYSRLRVYPSHYFLPTHWTGEKYVGNGPVYAHQYWGSSRGYDKIPAEPAETDG